MHLLLLPGMDGSGQLFEPVFAFLSPSLTTTVVAYPPDKPYGYAEILSIVEAAIPDPRRWSPEDPHLYDVVLTVRAVPALM